MSTKSEAPQSDPAWRQEIKVRAAELDRLVEAWLDQTGLDGPRLASAYRAHETHPTVQAAVHELLTDQPAVAAYFTDQGVLLDDVLPPPVWLADSVARDLGRPDSSAAMRRRMGRTV